MTTGQQASGYFGPVTPKDPNEDIISRDRAGRTRRVRASGRRRRDYWVVGYAVDNSMPLLLCFVMILIAVAVGYLVYTWERSSPAEPVEAVAAGPGAVAESLTARERGTYQFGNELTAAERLAAARFGTPLYVGDNGLPVIQVYSTGKIREMTPFEAEFPSRDPLSVDYDDAPLPDHTMLHRYQLPDRDYEDVYFHPGPEGEGVWYLDPAATDPAVAPDRLTRSGWERAQVNMVARNFPVLEALMMRVYDQPFSEIDTAWVIDQYDGLEAITDRVVGGDHDQWAKAPYRYVCDLELELERTGGVTQGCPSMLLQQALSYMWARFGGLVVSYHGMLRIHHPHHSFNYVLDDHGTIVYFTRYGRMASNESRRLVGAFRDVLHIAASEGFDFSELTWLGYPEVLFDARYSQIVEY